MIEIQNIRNSALSEVLNLLQQDSRQPIEVWIPKSTKEFFNSNEDIALDYAMLAFAGQRLKEISDSFSYDYISPSDHNSVRFEITTNEMNRLAEVLLYISYGYNNEPVGEEIYYLDEVYDFLSMVECGEFAPACEDFIDDYRSHKATR